MLLLALLLMAACSNSEPDDPTVDYDWRKKGVIILCEGNYQAGNSTLSYYNPEAKTVQNGVFFKANDAKMGDTGQSVQLHDGVAYESHMAAPPQTKNHRSQSPRRTRMDHHQMILYLARITRINTNLLYYG